MKPNTVTCEGCLEEQAWLVCEFEGKTLCRDCFLKASEPKPEPVPGPVPPEAPTAEDDRYCFHCGRDFRSAEHRYGTGTAVCRDCFVERENADSLCDICDGELSGPGWICEGNTCCEGCARTWAEEIVPETLATLHGEAAATEAEAEAVALSWLTFGRQFTPWWEFQTANAILTLLGKPERTY